MAVLGAPFDLAVTYRPGTRFGPRAVRLAEDVGVDERPSIELGIDPYDELTVVDYGDADAPASDVLAAHASIQARVGEILAAGAIPAVIGGDHSITLPILRALAAHHGADGFSVIHFDTHADTGEVEFEGQLPDHGQPFSRAVAEGVLLGGNIVQIGLRGCWPFPEPTSTACAGRASAGTRWARSTSAACAPCSTRRSPTPASALPAPTSRSTSTRWTPPTRPVPARPSRAG